MKLIAFVLIVLAIFAARLPMGSALESTRSTASVTYNQPSSAPASTAE